MGKIICFPGCCGPYVHKGSEWVCRKCGTPLANVIPLNRKTS